MKRNYVLIILVNLILGIFLGSVISDHNKQKGNYVSKDSLTKKEIKIKHKNVKKLINEKEKLEKEYEKLKKQNEEKEDIDKIDIIKEKLSYTDIKGNGVVIKIDALNEEIGNIANFIDYNKILIKIVNDLKSHGEEYISINDQRINQYSEIILAGNHININSTPIAPPYEIKSIGKELSQSYVVELNKYVEAIQKNYPLKIEIKLENNIELKKLNVPNKLKYIEGE